MSAPHSWFLTEFTLSSFPVFQVCQDRGVPRFPSKRKLVVPFTNVPLWSLSQSFSWFLAQWTFVCFKFIEFLSVDSHLSPIGKSQPTTFSVFFWRTLQDCLLLYHVLIWITNISTACWWRGGFTEVPGNVFLPALLGKHLVKYLSMDSLVLLPDYTLPHISFSSVN